jgi:heme a synthase
MPFDDRDFPNLPRGERATSPRSRRLIGIWLYGIAGMILVMVGLGGATRLTGSGLSIMEWAPVAGVLPPLSDAEWQRLYALYRLIPQYNVQHAGFDLADFKHIFWLEWTHRLWGRLIGLAFVLPLAWFWITGRVDRRLLPHLVGFLILGGLQGVVGWFMVASGFFPDATAVEPARLVIHLALALVLYAAVLWTALTLLPPRPRLAEASRALKLFTWTTLACVALTIVAGGFVAGLHAGLTYNTFPLMDGQLVPDGYADQTPFALNLIANVAAVQFNHRLLATMTVLSATLLLVAAWPYRSRLHWRLGFVGVAVLGQYALGVTTLLLVVPVGAALPHQIGATVLLTAVLLTAHALRRVPTAYKASGVRAGHGQTAHGSPFYGSIIPSTAADRSPDRSAKPRSAAEDPQS